MKHIFVINPAAGDGVLRGRLTDKLKSMGDGVSVYETKNSGDGKRFVGDYCRNSNEAVRFYACGGDGTLQELDEGIVGFENAELSCYPCGSGNDYVKCCGGAERFLDIERLINAKAQPVDLIKVNGRFSLNVVNFGFDTYVARTMIQVKHKKIIGGKNAYTYGVFKALFAAMKSKGEVYADGELLNPDGVFLLCTAANGQYVGGQFKCAPRSVNNDGLMDVCIVRPISRLRFVKLISVYKAGNHLEDPNFRDIMIYRRCKKLEVRAQAGFAISVDGEIVETDHFTCEIMPSAIRFAVPDAADGEQAKEAELAGAR